MIFFANSNELTTREWRGVINLYSINYIINNAYDMFAF